MEKVVEIKNKSFPWVSALFCLISLIVTLLNSWSLYVGGEGYQNTLVPTLHEVWFGKYWGVVSSLFYDIDVIWNLISLFFIYRIGRRLEFFLGWKEYLLVVVIVSIIIQQGTAVIVDGYPYGGFGVASFLIAFSLSYFRVLHMVSFFIRPLEFIVWVVMLVLYLGAFDYVQGAIQFYQVVIGFFGGLVYSVYKLRSWKVLRIAILSTCLMLCVSIFWAPFHTGWFEFTVKRAFLSQDDAFFSEIENEILDEGNEYTKLEYVYFLLMGKYFSKDVPRALEILNTLEPSMATRHVLLSYYMGVYEASGVDYDSAAVYLNHLHEEIDIERYVGFKNTLAVYYCLIGDSTRRDPKRGEEYSYSSNEYTDWMSAHFVDTYASCLAAQDKWELALVYSQKARGIIRDRPDEHEEWDRLIIEKNYLKIKAHQRIEF